MACIHYKFKNSLDYDSVVFDGLQISLGDLKKAIMQRKKLKDTNVDLHIINAITKKGITKMNNAKSLYRKKITLKTHFASTSCI